MSDKDQTPGVGKGGKHHSRELMEVMRKRSEERIAEEQALLRKIEEEMEEAVETECAFRPRLSLARTPPGGFGPAPQVMEEEGMAVEIQEEVPEVADRQEEIVRKGRSKRPLTSPEEVQETVRSRLMRRSAVEDVPPISGIAQGSTSTAARAEPREQPAGCATEASSGNDLMNASTEELVSMSVTASSGIMQAVRAKTSKLNKDEVASIGLHTDKMASVVMTLVARVAGLQAKLMAAEGKAHMVASQRGGEISGGVPVTQVPQYADVLKFRRDQVKPKPVNQGKVITVYPVAVGEEGTLKSAEDTKALLQKAINPRVLGVNINKVVKVGNAGVLIQAADAGAAETLKRAIPPELRVVEPKERQPMVAISGVDHNIGAEEFLSAMWEQNLKPDVSEENFKRGTQLAFRKKRGTGQSGIVVVRCTPEVRNAIVNKGKVYVHWERHSVWDYIDVVCCHKCQLYGHVEKYCSAKTRTCGKCGEEGHASADCRSEFFKCATCSHFKKPAEGHRTMAAECPARKYAEDKVISRINYG